MFQISVKSSELTKQLVELGKQMPARLARGMNFAVYDAKDAVQKQAPAFIDRPTPWTTNAIFATRATPEKLQAKVGYKNWTGSGAAPEYYMPQLTTGGGRNRKRAEKKLIGMGLMPPGMYATFGKAGLAQFGDQYGNINVGAYRRMFRTVNKAPGKRRKSEKAMAAGSFWLAKKNGKPSGIMVRWGKGANFGYFLRFVDEVSYRKQYPFIELMQAEFDRIIERALYRAIVLKK